MSVISRLQNQEKFYSMIFTEVPSKSEYIWYDVYFCILLDQRWATVFGLRATIETNLVYAGQYKFHKGIFNLALESKWPCSSPVYKKKHFKRHYSVMFNQQIKIFAGHVKVLCGPDVAWPVLDHNKTMFKHCLNFI